MADQISLDSKESFHFTQYLRSKQRTNAPPQATRQQELQDIRKRNVHIQKSCQLERQGLLLKPYLFEPEARLMRKCKYSKVTNYQHLYQELMGKTQRRLERPPQTADLYVHARIYRYLLLKTGKIPAESPEGKIEESFQKDYFSFIAMYQQRMDSHKQEELESIVHQIYSHRETILASEQHPDILTQKGFAYNESTFDDLFITSFEDSVIQPSVIDDGWESDHVAHEERKESKAESNSIRTVTQKPIQQEEMIDTTRKGEQEYQDSEEDEEEEEEIDINSLEPSKVNWFKYILDRYMKHEEGSQSALINADAYVNLLNIMLANKKNEEIQEELLDLVGYHNFELLEKLIDRREIIREQVKAINEKMQTDAQGSNYKGKNMDQITGPTSSVTVSYATGGGKKGKKGQQKFNQNQLETVKFNNYEVLRRLGFDRDFLDENRRLGLQERNMQESKMRQQYLMDYQKQRKQHQSQVFEKPEQKRDYIINTEDNDDFKYVQIVPPPKEPVPTKDLIAVTDLPPWARKAFGTTKHLNTIQSKVFPKAFKTKSSLLISAPTGAGKTNIALLSVLSEVSHHIQESDWANPSAWDMSLKQFKIIYIAPLKALASEIVGKFQAALAYLKMNVRELTGDMNMSKQEIQETHIIVSTPEKWDVVTRKTDGMMDLVNVIIIDEIHLLNDERGLVLECLVSRAMMASGKTQKAIRIVGLSATLPNYDDVARFIGADGGGTFYFDSSYRPTPLKCGFYGIKNYGNVDRANKIMNAIIYDNLKRILRMGKQVIIFVHRRAETVSAAEELIDMIKANPKDMHLFDCEKSYTMKSEVQKSRNEQVKKLFDYGFSVHNAGLLRKDRNLVERLFMDGHIKVLLSTATLAWGVNLPAYAVIIKGTKMYDASTGGYKDIGIFDVQQIFGRAGRPQFDHEGEAIILTLDKQMDEYVKMMSNKQTIESNLLKGLVNCVNAEISCGTICTLTDGIHWLKRSYYYQRVTKNPIAYGQKQKDIAEDPSAHFILLEKITESVKLLNRMQLIRYNEQNEAVYPTDMGRIASNYYINVETMSYFMENLRPHISEELFLYHLAHADEFKQLDARKEEQEELKLLMNDIRYVQVDKTCFNESHTKVLILFEMYLRKINIKTFSLISDMAYIVQNSARLLRAMFEIAMNKNYSNLAKVALRWCQILDKRLRPDDHPLQQMCIDSFVGKLTNQNQNVTKFGYLSNEVAFRVRTSQLSMDRLYEWDIEDVKRALGPLGVDELKKFVSYIPNLDIEVNVLPITRAILKVHLTIRANFQWNDRWNGKSEPFWIIVDNDSEILHSEFFALHKTEAMTKRKTGKKGGFKNEEEFNLTFFVPYEVQEGAIRIAAGTNYNLHVLSDRWYDIAFYQTIDLSEIQVPDEDYPHTKLLNLRPMSVKALGEENFEKLYLEKNIKFFNPVQTQVFHTLFHTDSNVLIGAPTGSGKTIMSEMAMLRVFKHSPKSKIIYVAPLKALAKERIVDWKKRLENGPLQKVVLELTGDITPDLKALQKADVLITTPEKWDGISRNWQHRSYVQQVALVVIDEIHLLGQERGPVIEVIVSRMRYIAEQTGNKVRFVGLSTALANAKDVADWLGIHKLGLYNFKPSVRPVPIKVFFDGFSEKHYCPRMGTMNKPAFKAIQQHSKDHPVLVFVSSRRQTRLTALDLIALCAADQQEKEGMEITEFKRPFLKMDPEEMHHISQLIKDENLRHTLNFGVGMHHAGLAEDDRKIVEDLFVKKKIQVLVTTSTLAWGVNFPARLVIIKGTEFFDPKVRRYVDFPLTDLLQMIGRAGRPQFDETGYACVFVHEEKKNFYKKFLYEPFPVESSLAGQLTDHLNAEIASGTLLTKQNCIDYLTWTYFFRRLTKNPAYYKLHNTSSAQGLNDFLNALVNQSLAKLVLSKCIEYNSEDETVTATALGKLASFYYLSHETLQYLSTALGPDTPPSGLIAVLANAKEFFGLPVRHNEDVLNEALTHLVPIKVPKHDLENPHVKANLLIQAHLQRCPMPITDYYTDTKSVLDQSIRVLQGMLDVSAHQGYYSTTVNLVHLMQMLIQGRWLDQSILVNIPHFTEKMVDKLKRMGVEYLPQLIERVGGNLRKFLQQELREDLSIEEIGDIYKALERVPKVDLQYSMVPVDDKNQPLEGELLTEKGEALLTINLKRLNKCPSQKVQISHFPKPKDSGYFLIVGNPAKNELLVMKRVSFNRFATKSLSIALPANFKTEKLELHLMSDSYIGLDQYHHLDLLNINAYLECANPGVKKAPKPQQSAQPIIKGLTSYKNLQSEVLADIHSDDEDGLALEKTRGIIDEKDDVDAAVYQGEGDGDEDEEDNEAIIEKDLDNWFN